MTPETGQKAEVVFAIGDIHGRFDLLNKALDAVEKEAAGRRKHVVFLGDYVDRGPDSAKVVETLMTLPQRGFTCLKGNHEAIMLEAFAERTRVITSWWFSNGGDATVRSYGGDPAWDAPTSFWTTIPQEHIDWMSDLPTVAHAKGRLLVHAGFMPGVPVEEQVEEEVMWIRGRFLKAERAFADWPHILHGHTWSEDGKQDDAPLCLSWRTNLDSCAYHSGRLSVAVLEGDGGPPDKIMTIIEE